jgi:hypothetical protein
MKQYELTEKQRRVLDRMSRHVAARKRKEVAVIVEALKRLHGKA